MIYFAFQSADPDALRATNIGAACDFEYIVFGGMIFGIAHSNSYKTRAVIDGLDANLTSLPGPALGTLQDKHIKHIAKAFPNAKKGDAMSTVLSPIYQLTTHEGFNPNNH